RPHRARVAGVRRRSGPLPARGRLPGRLPAAGADRPRRHDRPRRLGDPRTRRRVSRRAALRRRGDPVRGARPGAPLGGAAALRRRRALPPARRPLAHRHAAMSSAVVVGAGVFGASIARELGQRGWGVTVVEQYAPGDVRSGSGGETRLLRFSHGDDEWYARSALHALELWRELEAETGERLFEPVGVAWFDTGGAGFSAASEATLARLGVPTERLTPEEARRLYPSLGGDDLRSVLLEPGAGVLHARRATQALVRGLRIEPRHATPAD